MSVDQQIFESEVSTNKEWDVHSCVFLGTDDVLECASRWAQFVQVSM